MKKLIWLGCLSYLVIGIAHIIGGSILEQLVHHYGLTYSDGGQWIMNQFIGFLAGVLLGPFLSSKFGQRATVIIALVVLTVSETLYSFLLPWEWMLTFAPFAGFGFGMVEAIVGAMIIDIFRNGKASAMSKLETFFGVGALIIPLLSAFLIKQNMWQLSFPVLAVISGVALLLWFSLSFGKDIDEQLAKPNLNKKSDIKKSSYTKEVIPFLVFAMFFFFLYVGMEMSISNYLPSILVNRTNLSEASAAGMLSLFWGFMVLGRMFCGILADRYGYVPYLIVSMLGAVAAFAGMSLLEGTTTLLIMTALSGLFFSGIFGIALVYVNNHLPGMTERTTSLLVACGGLGGAICPKVTGWVMDRYNIDWSLSFIFVLVVVLLVFMIFMMLRGRQSVHQQHI